LNVLDNIKYGKIINIDFYYPYGVFLMYVYYLISLVIFNPIMSLIIAKALLDLVSMALLYLLLNLVKKSNSYLLYIILIAGIPVYVFSIGSLHASPIRYLILILPLIFYLRLTDKKDLLSYFFLIASPVVCYLMGPETGLISVAFVLLLLIGMSYDKTILELKSKSRIDFIALNVFIIFLFSFLNFTCSNFIKNSFQYASSIADGLVVSSLPQVLPYLKAILVTRSLDGASQLYVNAMFYSYFFPLGVLLSYSLVFVLEFIKYRKIEKFKIVVISLTFFALAYLFKALSGLASTGYESLTLIFVITAFYLLLSKYVNKYLVISKYILIIYVVPQLVLFSYFMIKTHLLNYDRYGHVYDYRSDLNLSFSDAYSEYVKSLFKFTSQIKKDEKVFIFSDEGPGSYYLINRPNYTHYLNTGFIYSNHTREILLADIKSNKFLYILIAKNKGNYINYDNSVKTLEYICPYINEHYKLINEDDYFKVMKLK
ncbi:MAG: hypothetical protein WCG01_03355, partial [bacterium]